MESVTCVRYLTSPVFDHWPLCEVDVLQ
jgi:hypothetical protein